jgi:hypothetical protein
VTMRGLAVAMWVMVMGVFPGAAAAQDPGSPLADPCGECRRSVEAEKQKCEGAARDAAAREACAKRAAEAGLTCQLGSCRGGGGPPLAAGTCSGCQHRVTEEERTCRAMPITSPEQVLCTQRVARLRTECETTVCKATPK